MREGGRRPAGGGKEGGMREGTMEFLALTLLCKSLCDLEVLEGQWGYTHNRVWGSG